MRRYAEVGSFVAFWMMCGWAASLDANVYLLLGVPLVLLFQRFVARRPLAALWVRSAEQVRLLPRDIVIASLLMVLPVWALVTEVLPARDWTGALWWACAILGTIGVALTLREQQRKSALRAFPYALAAVAWHSMILTVVALVRGQYALPEALQLLQLLRQFLVYLPVCFVLEEVVFRGALDSHIETVPTESRQFWLSALFISVLWGLWHVPIYPHLRNAIGVLSVVLISLPLGMLLSYTWRRGGTLLLPAIVHAAVDAYRNMLAG